MKYGFSLVELSIVLVILGLLTGGILGGQSLIRAAELRSITTEFKQYQTAVNVFKDKYFALPGDMTNATQFWGALGTGTCPAGTGTGTETCDGDGDGVIERGNAADEYNERYLFWQHLANAGLIEGAYSGKTSPNNHSHSIIGSNVPSSKFSNGGWTAAPATIVGVAELNFFEGAYNNSLRFGIATGDITEGFILTPPETWNIDSKIDDGKPGTGMMRIRENFTSCHDATPSSAVAVAPTAQYLLDTDAVRCSLILDLN